jgi:hypothetical protein
MAKLTTRYLAPALVFGALLWAFGGCATTSQAQDPQVAQADGDQAAISAEDDEELICRREHRTGTNIATRVCYTRAQLDWHAEDRRERDQQTINEAARWGCEGESCTQK